MSLACYTRCLLALPLLLPGLAWADGRYSLDINTGTSYGVQTATVEVRGELMRWSGQDRLVSRYGYVLIRGNRMYQVLTSPWPMAVDMALAVQSFGAQGLAALSFAPLFDALVSLDKTDAVETVAGVRGEIWIARVKIDEEIRRIELVLDGGKAAIDLRDAIQRTLALQSQVFHEPMPSGYLLLYNALSERDRGVLRYGQAFALQAADTTAPATSRFELP